MFPTGHLLQRSVVEYDIQVSTIFPKRHLSEGNFLEPWMSWMSLCFYSIFKNRLAVITIFPLNRQWWAGLRAPNSACDPDFGVFRSWRALILLPFLEWKVKTLERQPTEREPYTSAIFLLLYQRKWNASWEKKTGGTAGVTHVLHSTDQTHPTASLP